MKDNKVIIFDCFGLFATDAFTAYFLKHYGEKGLEIKDYYCQRGDRGELDLDEILAAFQKDLGIDPIPFMEEIDATYVRDPKMFALAKAMKEKHTVILLTNITKGTLERVFPEKEFEAMFDRVIRSYEVKLAKPDPAIFAYALSLLPKDHGRVVFFDDNPRNLPGATAVGIEAILFTSAEQAEEELKKRGY